MTFTEMTTKMRCLVLKEPFFSVNGDSAPNNELGPANRVLIDITLCFKTAFGLFYFGGFLWFVGCFFFFCAKAAGCFKTTILRIHFQ